MPQIQRLPAANPAGACRKSSRYPPQIQQVPAVKVADTCHKFSGYLLQLRQTFVLNSLPYECLLVTLEKVAVYGKPFYVKSLLIFNRPPVIFSRESAVLQHTPAVFCRCLCCFTAGPLLLLQQVMCCTNKSAQNCLLQQFYQPVGK